MQSEEESQGSPLRSYLNGGIKLESTGNDGEENSGLSTRNVQSRGRRAGKRKKPDDAEFEGSLPLAKKIRRNKVQSCSVTELLNSDRVSTAVHEDDDHQDGSKNDSGVPQFNDEDDDSAPLIHSIGKRAAKLLNGGFKRKSKSTTLASLLNEKKEPEQAGKAQIFKELDSPAVVGETSGQGRRRKRKKNKGRILGVDSSNGGKVTVDEEVDLNAGGSSVSKNQAREISFENTGLRWSNHRARRTITAGKGVISKGRPMETRTSSLAVGNDGVSDEQQSLEHDAARTLSSRFRSDSGTPGGIVAKVSNPSAEPGKNTGHASCVGSEKRVLKRLKRFREGFRTQKLLQKHRPVIRRYKEIRLSETDPTQLLDRRIKVFWPLDKKWYYGWIRSYNASDNRHEVVYDDFQTEWLKLEEEKFKLQFIPSKIRGRPKIPRNVVFERRGSGSLPNSHRKLLTNRIVRSDHYTKNLDSSSSSHETSRNGEKNERAKELLDQADNRRFGKHYVRRQSHRKPIFSDLVPQMGTVASESVQNAQEKNDLPMELLPDCIPFEMPGREISEIVTAEKEVEKMNVNLEITPATSSGLAHSLYGYAFETDGNRSECKGPNLSVVEYQPVGGFLFILCLKYHYHLAISGFSIGHFITSKELRRQCQKLHIANTSPSLHCGLGLNNVSCHNTLVQKQWGTMIRVWTDVSLNIRLMDEVLVSTLQCMGCCMWRAVQGVIKLLLSCSRLLGNVFSCFSLGPLISDYFEMPGFSIAVQINDSENVTKPIGFVLNGFPLEARGSWSEFKKAVAAEFYMLTSSVHTFSDHQVAVTPRNISKKLISDAVSSCSLQHLATIFYMSSDQISENSSQERSSLICCGFPKNVEPPEASREHEVGFQTDLCYCKEFTDASFPCCKINLSFHDSASVHIHDSQWNINGKCSLNCPPKFFLGLHYVMSSEKYIESIVFKSYLQPEHSEKEQRKQVSAVDASTTFSVDCLASKDSKTHEDGPRITVDVPVSVSDGLILNQDGTGPASPFSPKTPKVDVDASTVSTADGWVLLPARSACAEPTVNGTAAGSLSSQGNSLPFTPGGSVLKLQRCATSKGSWRFSRTSKSESSPSMKNPSKIRLEGTSYSHADMEIVKDTDLRRDLKAESGFTDMFNAEVGFWNQSRDLSLPHSQFWHDNTNKSDRHFHSGSIEPRKRAAAFSHLTFGENSGSISFKEKVHSRRGRPARQQREEKFKKSVHSSSSHYKRRSDNQSCNVNLLVTDEDKGWRENGAEVVIEEADQNEWVLAVRVAGATKFTHKPPQVMQSASMNRFTHVMMWRGGADWTLEFPDRKQWVVFKELHGECYNRNFRASTIRHIPVPVVREIEDYDCVSEIHFSRPASRYIRQVESEVEMALATSRVTYDMDSEDEEWLSQLNSSRYDDGDDLMTEVSEETFERIMDLLEKAAYTHQRELLNSDEVADFCWDIAPVEVVKAIHAHWQEKRWRRGMALVRHFQPACWERYQQQLKEWESLVQELQSSPNSRRHQMPEKPAMFAFCLKPRGLEVPNKIQKQKSHRKFNLSQHINPRDHQDIAASPAPRKHACASIGDESSSDAAGYVQRSSPSQAETLLQPPKVYVSAGLPESSTHLDSTDQKFKMHNSLNHRDRPIHVRKKAKKLRLSAASTTVLGGTQHSDFERRKNHSIFGWENGTSDQPNDSSYTLPVPVSSGYGMHTRNAPVAPSFDAERVQDATNATKASAEAAAEKKSKVQRMLKKVDLAMYKAGVAVATARYVRSHYESISQKGNYGLVENAHFGSVDTLKEKLGIQPMLYMNGFGASTSGGIAGEAFRSRVGHWQPATSSNRISDDAGTSRQIQERAHTVSYSGSGTCLSRSQSDASLQPIKGSSDVQQIGLKQVSKAETDKPLSQTESRVPVPAWGPEINT